MIYKFMMLICSFVAYYSPHLISLSSSSSFSLDMESTCSSFSVLSIVRDFFSCIVLRFSGQILAILNPNNMFFLVRDWSKAFST
jgi:hypothetical protein